MYYVLFIKQAIYQITLTDYSLNKKCIAIPVFYSSLPSLLKLSDSSKNVSVNNSNMLIFLSMLKVAMLHIFFGPVIFFRII